MTVAKSTVYPVSHSVRYQLDVVASSVAHAAQSAGGWLFDRAMAGWDVAVLVEELNESPLPLEILGVEVVDFEAMTRRMDGSRPSTVAIAVATGLCGGAGRIQHDALLAPSSGHTQVTLWGTHPHEADCSCFVEYQPSVAARAFKAQALAAAGLPADPISVVEVYRNRPGRCAVL